jgi:hypothetical protein
LTRASNRSRTSNGACSSGASDAKISSGISTSPDAARCCTREATFTVCPK